MITEDKLKKAWGRLIGTNGLSEIDDLMIEESRSLILQVAAELGYKWAVN